MSYCKKNRKSIIFGQEFVVSLNYLLLKRRGTSRREIQDRIFVDIRSQGKMGVDLVNSRRTKDEINF